MTVGYPLQCIITCPLTSEAVSVATQDFIFVPLQMITGFGPVFSIGLDVLGTCRGINLKHAEVGMRLQITGDSGCPPLTLPPPALAKSDLPACCPALGEDLSNLPSPWNSVH